MLPVTRQPDSGWQTSTPVGPNGAHERPQHAPPHTAGGTAATHTVPAGEQPPTPDAETVPQTPSAAPDAFVQRPPQHSAAEEQTSPI